MFDSITFCVGKKTISLYGQEFVLGELSVQVTNIWYYQTREMYDLLKEGKNFIVQYEETQDYSFWYRANNSFLKLETKLRQFPLFTLLQRKQSVLWDTTALEHRDWPVYKAYFEQFKAILNDITMFRDVIGHFTALCIMPLRTLSSSNISAEVNRLTNNYFSLYFPEEKRAIAYPYHFNKPITLSFHSREIAPETGEYEIIETYTTEELLMLLKIDFYKALSAGYLIRQCEYCGRFFLLTKRLHTKYCDNPAPDNPKYTCAQMGYRQTRRKEQPEDDPKADSLRRCLNRITQDCSRNIITPEERDLLKAKANELYHDAKIRSGVTYEEFETSLASRNLYPLCKVKRRSNPVGHPKTERVE